MPDIGGLDSRRARRSRENIQPNDGLSARKGLNVTLLPRRNFKRVIVRRIKVFWSDSKNLRDAH